ncbi:hypothetical protein Strain138_001104 [Pseudogemmatithrix spongiicola]|uniref:Glycosyltransferase RgtA/B/C/D-like domain-containing protein n=1 Tax=Pseudogemmatithrix spongiicola TaxID=3062599 RepID=A0AA49JZ88_9BACT|nr:hypothetical protein Strain138_001104 [Gemmatimonadaceae bacterium 'strain 138']WKW14746.1 hypothetical protein Strain318_001104 [Gemmatimonadaceae bacterium 'strain 318']
MTDGGASMRRWFWGLTLAVLVTRVAAILVLRTYLGDAGTYEHDEIARGLVEGRGFTFRFFADVPHPSGHQAPALPFLLALGYWTFGAGAPAGIAMAQVVLALLVTAGAMALGRIAWQWWGLRGMQLAMGAFLLYPAFAYMPTRVQTVNWTVAFLLLLLAGFVAMSERRGGAGVALGTGVAAGLGALGEPTLAAPFGLCWLALVWMRRDRLPLAVMVAVGFWVVVLPWSLRNQRVLGQFGPKSSFAYVAWQGNHIGASGTDKRPVADSTARALAWRIGGPDLEAQLAAARAQAVTVDADMTAADSAAVRALPDERARMQWFSQRLRADLAADPMAYLRVSATRARMLLWFDETNPRAFVAAYRVPYVLLLAIALGGLLRWRRSWRPGYVMWWAAVAGLSAVYVLVIMSARFRLPLEALFVLPAAGFLLQLTAWRSSATRSTTNKPT